MTGHRKHTHTNRCLENWQHRHETFSDGRRFFLGHGKFRGEVFLYHSASLPARMVGWNVHWCTLHYTRIQYHSSNLCTLPVPTDLNILFFKCECLASWESLIQLSRNLIPSVGTQRMCNFGQFSRLNPGSRWRNIATAVCHPARWVGIPWHLAAKSETARPTYFAIK